MAVRVRWACFDAAAPVGLPPDGAGDPGAVRAVRVHWAEFDALARLQRVRVHWAEFDARSPTVDAVPPFVPGGGVARYHSHSTQKYDIPVVPGADEDETLITAILMEIAAHVV